MARCSHGTRQALRAPLRSALSSLWSLSGLRIRCSIHDRVGGRGTGLRGQMVSYDMRDRRSDPDFSHTSPHTTHHTGRAGYRSRGEPSDESSVKREVTWRARGIFCPLRSERLRLSRWTANTCRLSTARALAHSTGREHHAATFRRGRPRAFRGESSHHCQFSQQCSSFATSCPPRRMRYLLVIDSHGNGWTLGAARGASSCSRLRT